MNKSTQSFNNSIVQVNSLFQQPWWLDAVAPGMWDEVVIKEGGEVVARLPYVIKKKLGFTVLTQPPLTQTLGPWIKAVDLKMVSSIAREHRLLNGLIEQLPKFDAFFQNFHYSIRNWLPFCWSGFSQTTRYTYRLRMGNGVNAIWDNFDERTRRAIRKASRVVELQTEISLEKTYEICGLTFKRQGKNAFFSFEMLQKIDDACLKRNARKIFAAVDKDGRIHSVIYMVFDGLSAYYLLGGSDPSLRSSAANVLLLWEAIKFSAEVSEYFDFEGSMIKPIEHFFRNFGGELIPYMNISKYSLVVKTYRSLRDLILLKNC